MKILYVAPRFHTNQFPVSKALVELGHEVHFLVQDIGVTEDHTYVEPVKMKLSLWGKITVKRLFKKYDRPTAESALVNDFKPAFFDLYKKIKEIKPDVVILRDRNHSTIRANFACKLLGIKAVVLYNQSALYTRKSVKQDILHKIVFSLSPTVRMTPSHIRNIYDFDNYYPNDLEVKEHQYFVPYVVPLNEDAEKRTYSSDGIMRILCTGKYRPYKNHTVLVDAFEILRKEGKLNNIHLTFLGQAKFDEEKEYKANLEQYVKDKGLGDVIDVLPNIPYSEMKKMYLSHDVYALTSHEELASISILEAMANAIPPISTSFNGTACFIQEKKTGRTFKTEDAQDLADVVEWFMQNKDKIPEMGKAGYNFVRDNCLVKNYIFSLNVLLKNEFGVTLQ